MNTVGGVLVVLHMIGWAIVLGGAVTNIRTGRLPVGMLHGALTAVVAGAALMGLLESGVLEWDFIQAKLITKFVLAAGVAGLVWYGERRQKRTDAPAGTGLVGAIAGVTAVVIALAVLWR